MVFINPILTLHKSKVEICMRLCGTVYTLAQELKDMANGDLFPHEQAMDELDAIVGAARRRIA